MRTTGGKLAELRKERGLTQAKLAEEAEISTSAIAMYETNRRQPDEETIRALATALQVSPDALREETNSALNPSGASTPSERTNQYSQSTKVKNETRAPTAQTRIPAQDEGANLTNLALTRDEARIILFIRMHPDAMPFFQNFMGADSAKRKQLEKAWRLIQAFQS